jgi:alkylation response protein AidB-like acyl-CoA dehydrogenase
MRREIFGPEHEDLRASWSRVLEAEVVPRYGVWERERRIPREMLRRVGQLGFLGLAVPEEYGGPGIDDFRFNAVINEECCRRGLSAFALAVTMQNDVALPYLLDLCSAEQRARWLPGIVSGEKILGLAMSEPQTGSDLQSIETRARHVDNQFVLSGAKTFITNGLNADLIITVVRTGRRGELSLVMVEGGQAGFQRGRNLEKLGQHAQDTAELFFDDSRTPVENLIGEEGAAFHHLTRGLAQERLSIAIGAIASARGTLERTLAYVIERRAFGRPIGTFQNSRFVLAQCRTEVEVAQAFVDRCVAAHVIGRLTDDAAAMAKLAASEAQGRVVDACLQLHGGYGYMLEYPVTRDYADARVSRIYGGTSEIMKEVIGRAMGLAEPRA